MRRPKSEFLFLRHLFASRPKTFSNGIFYEVGRHNDDGDDNDDDDDNDDNDDNDDDEDDDDNDDDNDDDVIAKRSHLKVTDTLEIR